MDELKLEDISIPHWVIQNNLVNEKGEPFEFRDHLFLYDILADLSPIQCLKKCAQIGGTSIYSLKSDFACDKGRMNVIFTMASDNDVSDFVKTKADKIFQANECIRDRMSGDTVGLKEIDGRFIHYLGTNSKTAAISRTADILIHDEIDRSNLLAVEQFRSRLGTSKYKGIWYLSNPSVVGVGIDVIWKKSDQKEWFIKCESCGEEQMLTWEENVDEIRKVYVCKHCGKILTDDERRRGRWIATKPENKEISGYHISQMMAPWLSAADLIREKEGHSEEYFRNFVLGEPTTLGQGSNFRQAITDSWTSTPLNKPPFFLGTDIGKIKHYVLGSLDGVFEIGTFEDRKFLEDLIEKYNPLHVMDAGPERTWAEEFRKKYPKTFICFFHKDKEGGDMIKWGGDKNTPDDAKNWGIVWADRTRVIDKTFRDILAGDIQFYLLREDLERYIKHWETMVRLVETTPQHTERYVWENPNSTENHFALATVYYNIARMRNPQKMEFVGESEVKREIIERTGEGFKMRNLEEVINERIGQDGSEEN